MAHSLEFWFDFASTYSYLSVMRIDKLAKNAGISTKWAPFLLGPIFNDQGWDTSPFSIYPNKGRYMWRDMERRAEKYDLPFRPPSADDQRSFPGNGLAAARIALVGLDEDWGRDFCRSVYTAQFAEGADIADPILLARLAAEAGAPSDIAQQAADQANKDRLRENVERARALTLFGAPTFTVGAELFWGDDRLEDAVAWCADH